MCRVDVAKELRIVLSPRCPSLKQNKNRHKNRLSEVGKSGAGNRGFRCRQAPKRAEVAVLRGKRAFLFVD